MTDKEYQHLLDLMERGIRANERRKFAEWLWSKKCLDGQQLLWEYEKEQKGEQT